MPTLLCFGAGFSGLEIMRHAKAHGFHTIGTVRCAKKAQSISQQTGLDVVAFDSVHIRPIAPTHIVTTIPTNGKIQGVSDALFDTFADDIKRLQSLQWFGYISTTGVYGNTNGDWVDETHPPNPSGNRGKSRVAMENTWLRLCKHTHIFRLAGIYGNGRSALNRVQHTNSRAIYKPNQIFGRIHTYDIAQTVVASMHAPNPKSIYNVVDDMPCDGIQVLQFACNLLQQPMIPIIPFEDADLSPMARSFYTDSRRVKNRKIKTELGVTLKYPDYQVGLNAIFQQKKPENAC